MYVLELRGLPSLSSYRCMAHTLSAALAVPLHPFRSCPVVSHLPSQPETGCSTDRWMTRTMGNHDVRAMKPILWFHQKWLFSWCDPIGGAVEGCSEMLREGFENDHSGEYQISIYQIWTENSGDMERTKNNAKGTMDPRHWVLWLIWYLQFNQSRNFNNLWNLGQTWTWSCLAEEQLWQIHSTILTKTCGNSVKSMYQLNKIQV